MPTLYHLPLSPACRKIRLLLGELQLGFSMQEENIWEQREAFRALNPACEVPVLVEEDGTVIAGNYAITEYLYEQSRHASLFGASVLERAEVRRLLDWFDNKFTVEVTHKLLHEKVFKRYIQGSSPDTKALREGKEAIRYHLDYIAYVLESRPWLAGEVMTVADLAAGAQLSAMDYLGDIEWGRYEPVKHWYSLLKSRPPFQKLLQERMRGITPPPYYDNPDF